MSSKVPGSELRVAGSDLVTPDGIAAAAAGLEGVVVRTPLIDAPWLDEFCGGGLPQPPPRNEGRWGELATRNSKPGNIRLKCENFQRAGAFKIRGAFTMLARLPEDQRRRGVITYSSGNHAQGVALAAKLFGVPAVVVMPTTVSPVKHAGAARLGAEVVLEGTTSIERQRKAEAIAGERGLVIVPAFDHPDIIAGQGTVGKEVLEDWPDVEVILVPVGGGGLLSGIAAWVKRVRPECLVVGVEPEQADAMTRSRAAGEPVTIDVRPTIADGLAPVRPGDLTFAHTQALVDDIVRVSEDAILDATRQLFARAKLVAEFSGAATTAALLSGAFRSEGRRCVAIVSGGNIDAGRALTLMAVAEPADGPVASTVPPDITGPTV